jgi:hypothetical protein
MTAPKMTAVAVLALMGAAFGTAAGEWAWAWAAARAGAR